MILLRYAIFEKLKKRKLRGWRRCLRTFFSKFDCDGSVTCRRVILSRLIEQLFIKINNRETGNEESKVILRDTETLLSHELSFRGPSAPRALCIEVLHHI